MSRNQKKSSKNTGNSSSSQPIGGSSQQQQQQEGYVPMFDPTYWQQQSPYVYPTPLFQNMNAFTPPQPSQFPSPQFQSPHFQQSFQSQQFQQSFQSQEFVPESEPEDEDEEEHEAEDHGEDEDEDEAPSKGKAKRKNWTMEQERILGRAWCDVSQDARHGNDQTGKQFWKTVTKRFNNELGQGPNFRSMHQCNSKWNKMNRDVQKYNGIYTNLMNQPRSGENEDDIRNRAEIVFCRIL